MCILLPKGPPFVLALFLAVGQSSSLLPVLAGSPCSLQPQPCASGAASCHLRRSPAGRCCSLQPGKNVWHALA